MSANLDYDAPQAGSPAGVAWIWAAAPLWLVYALVFAGTEGASIGHALGAGAANVAPLVALGLACKALLPRVLAGRPLAAQGSIHLLAAMIFASAWYGSVAVLLGCELLIRGEAFEIVGFSGPALTWQLLQGTILYCAVAAIVTRSDGASSPAGPMRRETLRRYLIRDGEDLRPVDVSQIVTIRGAQDYSEVATAPRGQHLVRMSLAEFAARLDPEQFIRVHRSSIVHLAHLDRLEPAGGGRMLAHMRTGEVVPVSRSGAQALRSLAV